MDFQGDLAGYGEHLDRETIDADHDDALWDEGLRTALARIGPEETGFELAETALRRRVQGGQRGTRRCCGARRA